MNFHEVSLETKFSWSVNTMHKRLFCKELHKEVCWLVSLRVLQEKKTFSTLTASWFVLLLYCTSKFYHLPTDWKNMFSCPLKPIFSKQRQASKGQCYVCIFKKMKTIFFWWHVMQSCKRQWRCGKCLKTGGSVELINMYQWRDC